MNANVAERINLFRTVRDIPYHIGLSQDDSDYSCMAKSPLLQKLFETIRIKSRRMYCRFLWKDSKLPQAILAKSPLPDCLHEYLEVFVPEKKKWIVVDATWDSGLKSAGFPVSNWNGVSPTPLGVKPVKFYSPRKSDAIREQIEGYSTAEWNKFFKQNRAFFKAMNNWLEQRRRHA
jgi:hypothetical protein